MQELINKLSENVLEDINDQIDNTIHWALDDDSVEYSEELELKVKQQVLFSLIKTVTK